MQCDRRKKVRQLFNEIDRCPEKYLIIHYSCEGFYNINDGYTPRITSIAIYNYDTGQTDSFSIHKKAECLHINFCDIRDHYDELERAMLDDFFKYIKEHPEFFWIHWNMRDINYGFKAIEHRYSVLGGSPYEIHDDKKIDLSQQLVKCYGENYISHPRIEKLLEKNDIKVKDFLSGQQEADAFKNQEYVKLHMSTLRKVDIFADILHRAINNTLQVDSTWKDWYGLSMQGIIDFCRDTWWIQGVWTILSMFLGALIGIWVERLLV